MSNREKTKWCVDGIYFMDDGSIVATHLVNKTVAIIKPTVTQRPDSDPPEFRCHYKIEEPDGEERLYYLHKYGIMDDNELSIEMAKQPKQKKKDLITRLHQEVDNVPG